MSVFIMDEQKINILYCFDTRFWRLAAVSVYSLLKNKNAETQYNIYCMVAPHTRGKKKIQEIINQFPGTSLIWRPIKKHENPFQTYEYSRWSPVIFYRLIAHRIFPELDKILYIDSDTLICDDLGMLYNTDISDYVMAAVPDVALIEREDDPVGKYVREFMQEYLNNGIYYNSGVLLLNLKNIAKYQELLLSTKIPLKYPDQDLLNAAFVGKIKTLELKYNYIPGIMYVPSHIPNSQLYGSERVILHFYAAKPYNYNMISRMAYSLFYKNATAIGMHPEDFIKHEQKYLKHIAHKKSASDAFPFIRIKGNQIKLFGITLTRI